MSVVFEDRKSLAQIECCNNHQKLISIDSSNVVMIYFVFNITHLLFLLTFDPNLMDLFQGQRSFKVTVTKNIKIGLSHLFLFGVLTQEKKQNSSLSPDY